MLKFMRYFLSGLIFIAILALLTQIPVNDARILFTTSLSIILLLIFLWSINSTFAKYKINSQFLKKEIDSDDSLEVDKDDSSFEKKLRSYVRSFIIMCVIWIVPSLLSYLIFDIERTDKVIKVTVFVISLICSTIYFLYNREKFKGPGDKVGYFSGAILGPVGVAEILFL